MAMILSFVTAWVLAGIVMAGYSVCSSQFWSVGVIRKALDTLGGRPRVDTSKASRMSGSQKPVAA